MTERKKTPAAGLAGKLMLSGMLLLGSGAYAWWERAQDGGPHLATQPPPPPPALASKSAGPENAAPPPHPQPPQEQARQAQTQQDVAPPTPAPRLTEQAVPAQADPQMAPAVADTPPPAPTLPQVALASNAPPVAAAPAPVPAPPPPPSRRYADGDFTGPSTDTPWGTVQVRVSIRDGAIADIAPIDYPQHRRRSIQINEWALPMLAREVIQAQSAAVDIVSQATTTSVGYQQSLAAALAQAIR